MDNSILQTYNGLIRFYDGTIIAIEEVNYSPDGLYNWELIFNPNDHLSTIDGITLVKGHKYRRVKHTGDTNFQLPYRIVPKEPEFRLNEGLLEWKFIEDLTWITLLDTETLRGEKGDTGDMGIQGDGINIDAVGYLKLRPDCTSGLIGSSTCTSCNPGSNSTSVPYLFLSIGDGILVLTAALIAANTVSVGGVSYTHFSNDLVNWVALSTGIVDFECRYLATNSTGAVYTDMRLEDYYSSRGKVYICADGRWTLFVNLNVPLYMVQESTGSPNIGYLDIFVDALENSLTGTITISNGKLEVIEYSIDATAFKQDTFTDGLDYTESDTEVKVKVEDFDGFGLRSFVATSDSEGDLQVYVQDFILDGLTYESTTTIDGETRDKIIVKVDDFVSPTTGTDFTGLETSADRSITETDGYENIYVKEGDCLLNNVDGVNVVADEITIEADTLLALRVKDNGITKEKVNVNVFNTLYGFNVTNLDTSGVEIKLSTISPHDNLEFSAIGTLQFKDNGVHGSHLNDDTCDELFGIKVVNDKLNVLVDGTTIGFVSGELAYIGTPIDVVTSLTSGGATMQNDIIYTVESTTGSIEVTLAGLVNVGSDTLNLNLNVSDAYINALINDALIVGATPYWGILEYSATNSITIEDYITSLGYVKLNTLYSNIEVRTGVGLVIKSNSGLKEYKLICDDNGNLDTTLL